MCPKLYCKTVICTFKNESIVLQGPISSTSRGRFFLKNFVTFFVAHRDWYIIAPNDGNRKNSHYISYAVKFQHESWKIEVQYQ